MRIIKKGEMPEVICDVTCHLCKTVFSVTPDDVTKKRNNFFSQYLTRCPVCGQEIDVSNEKIDGKQLYVTEAFTAFCKEG